LFSGLLKNNFDEKTLRSSVFISLFLLLFTSIVAANTQTVPFTASQYLVYDEVEQRRHGNSALSIAVERSGGFGDSSRGVWSYGKETEELLFQADARTRTASHELRCYRVGNGANHILTSILEIQPVPAVGCGDKTTVTKHTLWNDDI